MTTVPADHPEPDATAASRRPTAVLTSDVFLGHDTGNHVEQPNRLRAVLAELDRRDLRRGRPEVPFDPATRDQILRIHTPAYLDLITAAAADGGGYLDSDTLVLPDSVAVATLAAGAAVAAVDAVLAGTINRAMVLSRPPGHHATPARGMGFCLLNSVAIAAAEALARGCQRVLILDWDVHHGNGTQDAFYDRSEVFFCSLHQSPLYPGTGGARERGTGPGAGSTLNIPLPAGSDDVAYIAALHEQVWPAAVAFAPDVVLVSAGFDAHPADPIASMRVTEAGFTAMARFATELAATTAHDRLVTVLEGGYDQAALGRCIAAVLEVFDTAPIGGTRKPGGGTE